MMSQSNFHISFGAKDGVREVRLTNRFIRGGAITPLLFVLMTDWLVKVKTRLGVHDVLSSMDEMKASGLAPGYLNRFMGL